MVDVITHLSKSSDSSMNMTNTTAPADKSIQDSAMIWISMILNTAFLYTLLLLNPALLANLLALSDTALEANKLIMKKTMVLFGLLQIVFMVLTYLTMDLGMLVKLFCNIAVVFYGIAVLIVISVVAADFVKDSSSLDSVLNSRDLIEESEKLVQRYRKLKSGMSPLLFINCVCCTVVLVTSAFFTIIYIRNNDFGTAAMMGIVALYNLTITKCFTSLSGSCYEELYRNYDRLRLVIKITTQ